MLKTLKYLHKNISLVVHFRCAICPAPLLANTKMQYLLRNIYHLKWIRKWWWYCGRQVCPHVRKIRLWAQGWQCFSCAMHLSPHSKDNLPALFPQWAQRDQGFNAQHLCLQWVVIKVLKALFLLIALYYLFLCFCISHGNEESIF